MRLLDATRRHFSRRWRSHVRLAVLPALSTVACALVLGLAMPSARAQTQLELQTCLRELAPVAARQSITADTFRALTGALEPDPDVLEKLDFQPEFVRPVWDYLASLVDAERIEHGQERLASEAALLARIENQFGVSGAAVLAIWGVESDYGRNLGSRNLLRSLSTLSCFGRRQSFFRDELIAALQIVANGHIAVDRLQGSWAGAFGQTQFMPSTFRRVALDLDGDERRDLIGSVADALGSTAAYLKEAGWQTGAPWGFEVRLPAGVIAHADSRADRKPLADWLKAGVTAIDDDEQRQLTALPGDTRAALIRPANTGGPTFIIFRNFDAVHAYNPSVKYALAILHLADRIQGKPGFKTAWPTTDESLDRAQSRELQELLTARGHDIGPVDGILGPATRGGVRAEQLRLGLPETGFADRKFLQTLRDTQ